MHFMYAPSNETLGASWIVTAAGLVDMIVAVQPPAPQNAEEQEQRQPEPKTRPRRTASGTGTSESTLPIIVTMALWSLDDQYVITALSDYTIKVKPPPPSANISSARIDRLLLHRPSCLRWPTVRCGTPRPESWCTRCCATRTRCMCWTPTRWTRGSS